jgi:hypothetical protein
MPVTENLEMIWKESIVAYFQLDLLSKHLLEGLRKPQENLRISLGPKIKPRTFQITKYKCKPPNRDIRCLYLIIMEIYLKKVRFQILTVASIK